MNYKAIGLETKHIYIVGTHPECVRYVNEKLSHTNRPDARINVLITHDEPIKIIRADQTIETDDERLGRLEKEWQLSTLKERAHGTQRRMAQGCSVIWDNEKDDWILANRCNYAKMTQLFEARFGQPVTDSALKNRTSLVRKARGIVPKRKNLWTAEDDAYLIKNNLVIMQKDIAKNLGRTVYATKARIIKLKDAGKL